MSDTIVVKFAETKQELKEVMDLIVSKYDKEFNVFPEDPAEYQVIVVKDGDITGTLGIDFGSTGRFPIEEYFTIHDERFAHREFRDDVVELMRWASRYPLAGGLASFGANTFALKQGRHSIITCMREKQLQRITSLSAQFTVLSATLKPNNPFPEYFETPPPPQVIMADLKQWQHNTRSVVVKLQSEGIKIDFRF